jgi:hypothetical protein
MASTTTPTSAPQHCPFCGAEEKERFVLEDRLVLVFPCMFSPVVDPAIPEESLGAHLQENYGSHGRGYFQRQCNLLHYYVTQGKGAKVLQPGGETSPPAP